MKKVLFVISSLKKGGAERALSNITIHFPKEWDIDILINNADVIDYPFRGNIITLGIEGKTWTNSVFFQFKLLIKRIKMLRHLKKSGEYQACISFLDSANIANILSGKRYCRVILSVRSSLQRSAKLPEYKYLVNPLVKLLYNRADQIVAVSKGVEKELLENFHLAKSKVITIDNGYDVLNIQKQGQEELQDNEKLLFDNRKVVVTAGRLTDPKGQWHLIRAFTEVIKKVPDAFLVILGSGELEQYLRQLTKTCGMDDFIHFTGFVSNPYKYMSRSDVFVFPSLYEGFPNALAEAVCLGLPCIATDFHAGAREILAPDLIEENNVIEGITEVSYGMLTPVCSGKQYKDMNEPLETAENYLAQAIVRMLTNEEKMSEYGAKSKQRREFLKMDAIVNKWVELIEGF